jgi:hypothetical protein
LNSRDAHGSLARPSENCKERLRPGIPLKDFRSALSDDPFAAENRLAIFER